MRGWDQSHVHVCDATTTPRFGYTVRISTIFATQEKIGEERLWLEADGLKPTELAFCPWCGLSATTLSTKVFRRIKWAEPGR